MMYEVTYMREYEYCRVQCESDLDLINTLRELRAAGNTAVYVRFMPEK